MVESGKTATAFRNIIFREGQQYVGLSGEKKNEFSSMFYTGWILYRHYGLRVEDLAITEDGEIFGLTDDFYNNIKKLIERGGSSEDDVGRIVYKEGNIFVL